MAQMIPLVVLPFNGNAVGFHSWKVSVETLRKMYTADKKITDQEFAYATSRALVGDAEKWRSEEHTSELQSLMRISYAVFCLKKKTNIYYKHIKVNEYDI